MKKFIINELNNGIEQLKYESDNWSDIVEFLKNAHLTNFNIYQRIGENDKKVIFSVLNKIIISPLELLFKI